MTATQNPSSKGGRMAAHVHPETYVPTDPLDWRRPQLHTSRAHCTQSMCTFQDYDAKTQAEAIQWAADLRAELRAAARPMPSIETRDKRAQTRARNRKARQELAQVVELPQPTPAPEPTPRKSLPNAERRTEATHPDGGSAVSHGKCPQCGSRKGVVCTSKLGAPTNAVHAPRMRAWEAAGSPVLPMPAPARKRGGVWVVAK